VRGGVIEFMVIIAPDDFDGAFKLCGDISKKIKQSEKSVRFNT
jgi:hypothetical protein